MRIFGGLLGYHKHGFCQWFGVRLGIGCNPPAIHRSLCVDCEVGLVCRFEWVIALGHKGFSLSSLVSSHRVGEGSPIAETRSP